MTVIATLTREDVSDVLLLAEIMHNESRYSHLPFDPTRIEFALKLCLETSMMQGFVVHKDSTLVGFYIIGVDQYLSSSRKLATDAGIYIHPDHRSYGLFRRLHNAVEQWCRDAGVQDMAIEVSASKADVDIDRTGLVFERLGFKPWGVMYRKEL